MLPVIVADKPFIKPVHDRLAQAIGEGVEDPREVARAFGIPSAALASLMETEEFIESILESRAVWLRPENAAYRIRRKIDAGIEEVGLTRLCEIAGDPGAPPGESLKAINTMNTMSSQARERDEMRAAASSGGGNSTSFNITLVSPAGVGAIAVGRGGEKMVSGEVIDVAA